MCQSRNKMKKKLVVLTGAGISQESGIKTFRDSDGLWENFHVSEVASIEGWHNDPALVLDFYNQRRAQLHTVVPNSAHEALKNLEKDYDVTVITQNVDDLHERAGSSNILHLHGQLTKMKSIAENSAIYDYNGDIKIGDMAPDGLQLRPHIVWFGEMVPEIENAASICAKADILLIIGTSLQVYPAAGLMRYAPNMCPIYLIDPNDLDVPKEKRMTHIKKKATDGMVEFMKMMGG
jgi:NAD-dependent deacetylase